MKIYGTRTQIADNYFEVYYGEYRDDGTLKATGTEDFTRERWNKQAHMRFVYTWDGVRRNTGGKRWFEFIGAFFTDDPKAFKKYMQTIHADAELVDIGTR